MWPMTYAPDLPKMRYRPLSCLQGVAVCVALGETGRAPAMVIEVVYDTPLDDIATALNRFCGQGAVSA